MPGSRREEPRDPSHVFTVIARYLPVADLPALSRVCKDAAFAVFAPDLYIHKLKLMGLWQQPIVAQRKSSAPEIAEYASTANLQPADSPLALLRHTYNTSRTARFDYATIYITLRPFLRDLAVSRGYGDLLVFRKFRDPEDQAALLRLLAKFTDSDTYATNYEENVARLRSVREIFESAALREAELGYDTNDFLGTVRRYAKVLISLGSGDACVQLFLTKHPLTSEPLGNPTDCLGSDGSFRSEPAAEAFGKAAFVLNDQAEKIDIVFPPEVPAMLPLAERVLEDYVMEYASAVFDQARQIKAVNGVPVTELSATPYLVAVPQIYSLLRGPFLSALTTESRNIGPAYHTVMLDLVNMVIDPYLEVYFSAETSHFAAYARLKVRQWASEAEKAEQQAEDSILRNVSREKAQDKVNFLSSFRNAFRMPFGGPRSVDSDMAEEGTEGTATDSTITGNITSTNVSTPNFTPHTPPGTASTVNTVNTVNSTNTTAHTPATPLTAFEAQAAIMAGKLESMRQLFSLELALDVLKAARESIERLRTFTVLKGQREQQAKARCQEIFVSVVEILGEEHIRRGFDQAIERLKDYSARRLESGESGAEENSGSAGSGGSGGAASPTFAPNSATGGSTATSALASEATESSSGPNSAATQIQPLTVFAEVVNIADLIQQMIHIFFEEELSAPHITDRNDFLSPAVKAKKRFEIALDDCVATGLNSGIDALINQIELILATDQPPSLSPFNPAPQLPIQIGPTNCATKIVRLLSLHTSLLQGSADKAVLDIFHQEVGVRFFTVLGKHIKRHIISVSGSIVLISDLNCYYDFICSLKLRQLVPYFAALKEIGSIYLIDGSDARAIGKMVADYARFRGVFTQEEIYEFVQRRADWLRVRKEVEKVMYGLGVGDCVVA